MLPTGPGEPTTEGAAQPGAGTMPEGDALLWTGFWALVVGLPLLWLVVWALVDLVRLRREAWWIRLSWAGLVVVIPLAGALAYWLLRPAMLAEPEPSDGAADDANHHRGSGAS